MAAEPKLLPIAATSTVLEIRNDTCTPPLAGQSSSRVRRWQGALVHAYAALHPAVFLGFEDLARPRDSLPITIVGTGAGAGATGSIS